MFTGPEKYTSPWCTRPVFLIRALLSAPTWVTVPNGEQPKDGMEHVSERDARQWLKDNGFERTP